MINKNFLYLIIFFISIYLLFKYYMNPQFYLAEKPYVKIIDDRYVNKCNFTDDTENCNYHFQVVKVRLCFFNCYKLLAESNDYAFVYFNIPKIVLCEDKKNINMNSTEIKNIMYNYMSKN